MTQITNHTEYTAAVNEAKLHDYRYFTLNAPTISDEDYDRLYFAIQEYETQHPDETLADSPTQSAHGEVKNGHKQIRRRTEMLSTEKAQTIEKVQKWMTKTTKKTGEALYTVEWKYDGISLSLVYLDGQLTEASYGKGMEGNDCLEHCLKVASIPNIIPASGRVEVRGEMVVPFANLAKTGYKNCRSAASGIMADTQSTLMECLEFHPYWASGLTAEADDDLSNNVGVISALQGSFGFLYDGMENSLNHTITMAGIDRENITLQNIEQIIAIAEQMRPTLAFPTDGLVIKVADIAKWDSLGRNDHHPHYAIAYKFAAATAETTITRIEVTVGKTGKRTPVAYFEPIVINGSTYQKASTGSEAKLAELGIAEGSRVIVSLRNDVIPHIEKTIADPLPDPLPSEGEGVDTTEPCVIEAENNQAMPETATPRNIETSVEEQAEETEQTEDSNYSSPYKGEAGRGSSYTTPAVTPVTVVNEEPICAPTYVCPVTEPVRHHPTPLQGARRAQPKRKYRMAGEPRIQRNTNGTASIALEQEKRTPWFAYVFATIAVVAFIILCFAGLGAAVFFLPLLAGAFK